MKILNFKISNKETLNKSIIFNWALWIPMVLFVVTQSLAQSSKKVSWSQAQHQNQEWYGSDEAVRIAENVLLYQNNNGGWLKNIDMANELDDKERSKLKKEKSKKIGTTIDNNATHTQMRYLAKVYQETGQEEFKEGFLKGLNYLLEAQYENGGWAQYYPERKGYYEHITFNDHAMIGVMSILKDISDEVSPYEFVEASYKKRIDLALEKGVEVILKMQIKVDGELTAWCAQHNRHDLRPAKARAYELPSISGGESVGVVGFLMSLDDPSPEVQKAIESAVAWFEKVKIEGIKVVKKEDKTLERGYDRIVVEDAENSQPLWARFYEIDTNRPMFVGRNGIVKYNLSEIEHERRVGYSYLGNYAEKLLEKDYPQWKAKLDM
ncbi:pectate lyase [Belliella marina]|uniref:Pectate lyase n=1 Tax=Belliella marina TaxID=1644146 RepID=A0ABW4VHL0_9BACT